MCYKSTLNRHFVNNNLIYDSNINVFKKKNQTHKIIFKKEKEKHEELRSQKLEQRGTIKFSDLEIFTFPFSFSSFGKISNHSKPPARIPDD